MLREVLFFYQCFFTFRLQKRLLSTFWAFYMKSFRALVSFFLLRTTSSKRATLIYPSEAALMFILSWVTGRSRGSLQYYIGEIKGVTALRSLRAASAIWWELLISLPILALALTSQDGPAGGALQSRLLPQPRHLEVVGDCMFQSRNQRRYGSWKEYCSNLLQHSTKMYFVIAIWLPY